MSAPTPIQIAAFLKRYSPHWRNTPRERLVPVVEWYHRDARVGVLRSGGNIVAVALARAMHSTDEADTPYHHDESGKIVWIDNIVSRHPEGISQLLSMAMRRFGPREAFAGHVFNRAGQLRMLPWKTVERLASVPQHHVHQRTGSATAA